MSSNRLQRLWTWLRGLDEPVLGDRHDVLIRLSYREINRRLDAAERSVSISSLVYIVFAALLWVWLVAPSFNLLPATIRAVLTVISYLGYGIFGAANSPVANFASYVNLGYGIIAGTPILALLAYYWLNKERNLTGTLNAVYSRPDLKPFRMRPRRRLGALIFASIAFIGVTSATQNRFFTLTGYPMKKAPTGCATNENWTELWKGSRSSIWGWLLPYHRKDNQCVEPGDGFFAAYTVILPHTVFETQLDRNREIEKQIRKIAGETQRLSADVNVGLGTIHAEWGATPIDTHILESHFVVDPWQNWPDIRPPLNLLILWAAALAQILLLVRVYRHTSGKLIV